MDAPATPPPEIATRSLLGMVAVWFGETVFYLQNAIVAEERALHDILYSLHIL
jgi:hypothetical protein